MLHQTRSCSCGVQNGSRQTRQNTPPPSGGTLGYCTCAQEAISTKRRTKIGSSVACKTRGIFLSQRVRQEDDHGEDTNQKAAAPWRLAKRAPSPPPHPRAPDAAGVVQTYTATPSVGVVRCRPCTATPSVGIVPTVLQPGPTTRAHEEQLPPNKDAGGW